MKQRERERGREGGGVKERQIKRKKIKQAEREKEMDGINQKKQTKKKN